MSTKHVILALLDIAPMSGYDLSQNMKISLNSLWAATYGQIYPTLHKLEAAELVRSASPQTTSKRQRIVYSLTECGRAELKRWLHEPITYLPYRDPFMLWAVNIDQIKIGTIIETVETHIAKNSERAVFLDGIASAVEADSHPLIRERIRTIDLERLRKLKATRAFIFRELAQQARHQVESAERILTFAQSLHAPTPKCHE